MTETLTFYWLRKETKLSDSDYVMEVELNPHHDCYRGHFPGSPVAPGVLLTEMMVGLSSGILGRSMFLIAARDIKFIAVVNPFVTPFLQVELRLSEEEAGFKVSGIASHEGQVYFKFNGTLAYDN